MRLKGVEAGMRMIDVFSGFGGQSEAMLNHGWEVKRIDNNMLLNMVPNITIQDAQSFLDECKLLVEAYGLPYLDYLHFSPPCLEFSNAYNSPKTRASRNGEEYKPSLDLIYICLEIIDTLKPRFWSIENVLGAVPYFEPILGPYRQHIGPYYYWGTFPLVSMPKDWRPPKKNESDPGPSNPLRANFRAIIPYEISNAFRCAIESQLQLTYWFK